MSTDFAVLQTRLAEAETAKHNLVTGNRASVVVDQNGERVEFQRSSITELNKYIQELKNQIAVCSGEKSNNGPIWVWGR